MADIKVELKNSLNSKIYPKTTLDNIVKSVASSTTLITSGGVIKKDFLDLTGLINASYVSSANVIPTSAVSGFDTAAKNAASTYVNSNSVIPQSAVSGLSTALSGKMGTNYEDYIQLGRWLEWQNDNEIGMARYHAITTVTGASVYIQPGEAYVIDATTTSKTLNVGSVPSGYFGLESQMEIFVANTGYVRVGSNVTLVDPLEPDAVNNCTVRFHNGHAIISVEDHIPAYIVASTGTDTTSSGTLAYGLTQTGDTYTYIGFNSELNTSVIPFGTSATKVKRLVGNGCDVGPILSGTIKTTSNMIIRDCKVTGIVSSGVCTLGNAKVTSSLIISGGTCVLDGALVGSDGEFVTSGGVCLISSVFVEDNGRFNPASFSFVDGAQINATSGGLLMLPLEKPAAGDIPVGTGSYTLHISGGVVPAGHRVYIPARGTNRKTPHWIVENVKFEGTSNSLFCFQNASATLINCDFSSAAFNTNLYSIDTNTGNLVFSNCTLGNTRLNNTSGTLIGRNDFIFRLVGTGKLYVEEGAVISLQQTKWTNSSYPQIQPGAIIVANGDSTKSATIINNGGVVSYISGGTYTSINHAGVVV